MPEALTQSQIDELLNRMRSGDSVEEEAATKTEKEKVKKYDFSSPKKFTKDQIKSLSNLYENFARVLSSYLTSILRTVQEVTISHIEEQQYYEFSNALPDNTFIGMIDYTTGGEEGSDSATMMMEMSSVLCFTIVERLLGGMQQVETFDRPYTEIELALLESVMERVTQYLQDTWQSYFPMSAKLQSIETNGRLLQAYAPQDIVIIISVDVKNDEGTTNANICMPAENLERLINTFNGKYAHVVKKQDPDKEKEKQEQLMELLKQSDLVLEAVLDNSQMSLGDVSQLQVNDVISLGKRIDGDIIINVEGIPWYTAKLGVVGKKKAFKIVDAITTTTKGGERHE